MNDMSLIGTKLGKYEIQAEIGRGGMGAVFKGYDPALDRQVAVKVLAPHLVWQEGFVERFLREARAAARLQHPNIVTIYDVGQQENWYYYVMEYLEGQTLTDICNERGPLAPETVISILRPLAEALDYAHQRGLVHRDIKPSNIMVNPTGRVVLTDFGIARAAQEARLTATGTTVGTPEYMSPEQVQGQEVEAQSDQYSLGVVAYEMLSGQVPFQADSTLALMYKVAHDPPPPIRQVRPDLPAPVEEVLNRALAKEPASRYPTVSAFAEALSQALAGKRVKAAAAAVVTPKPTPPRQEAATVLTEKDKAAAAAAGAAAAKRARTPVATPAARPPTQAKPQRRSIPWWVLLLAALAVLLCVVAAALALSGRDGRATPTAIVIVVTPGPTEGQALPTKDTSSPTTMPSPTVPAPGTATHTAAPTMTLEPEPSAEPPTVAPSATATVQDSPTPLPTTVVATATSRPISSSTPSATSTAAEVTATATSTRPAATATEPAPTEVPATPTEESPNLAAPTLMSPGDGQEFAHNDQIVLEWQPVGQLPEDGYYEVIVEFTPAQDPQTTWTDETPWVKTPRWTLSKHDYLPGLSADNLFRWSVRVMRKTGETAQGRPKGTPLSPVSTARTLTWQAPPQAGGGGGSGAPTSPPP